MINVIGLGYIGLPTSLILAANGNDVVGTDCNEYLINKLTDQKLTFQEDGLADLFKVALSNDIQFSKEYVCTDFYIVTVPTPYDKKNKKIDATYVIFATKEVLKVCQQGTILVIESTIAPGTIDKYIRPLIENSKFTLNKDIFLVHAPERILPGNMLFELKHNSRTIGADLPEIAEKVKDVYSTFCEGEIVCTDIRIAEMSKVVENTYRAVNIAFANELNKIAHFDNFDVHEIIKIANMHPRVNILNPGPGVGGHCIPIDPWFLVGEYPNITNLISSALEVNESMPELVLKRIREIMEKHNIYDKNKIGIYGLTYKQDVDDFRESPTIQMFEKMKENFSSPFRIYDPMVKKKIFDTQEFNFEKFISESEIIVLMVPHSQIKLNKDLLEKKIILDPHNLFDFTYKL